MNSSVPGGSDSMGGSSSRGPMGSLNDANTSLMIRGRVIMSTSESQLLDIFSRMAPVRDIRLVRNKDMNTNRD